MVITESMKDEIIVHIKQAKDKRKQVQIEADLHGLSKGQVKDIMKEKGISLRILNGDNLKKRPIEDELMEQDIITPVEEIPAAEQEEDENVQAWKDLAIPPHEEQEKPGKLDDVQDIPQKPYSKLAIFDVSPRAIKDVNTEDALIVGTHILEDDKVFEAIQKKIEKMKARRRGLVAEIEAIDTRLRKYAFFYEDLYDDIQKEGVEI